MAGQLDACEKELHDLLKKVDDARKCLLEAVDAIQKAKSKIRTLPDAVLSNESLLEILSSVVLQQEDESSQKEEAELGVSLDGSSLLEKEKNEIDGAEPISTNNGDVVAEKDEMIKLSDERPEILEEPKKSWKERGKIEVRVVSSLLQNGRFWCVPTPDVDLGQLKIISEKLRKETMSDKSLWNCDTTKKDQIVCVLSKSNNLWLRGIVEKSVSDSELILRYIDNGKTEKVPKNRVNRIPEDLKDLDTLMKWNFKDLTNGRTLNVEIKEEIKDGIMPCYVVSLRDQENEAIDIADEICNGEQADSKGMAGMLPSKDVRIYGEGSDSHGQLSVIRDVHNVKGPAENPEKNAGDAREESYVKSKKDDEKIFDKEEELKIDEDSKEKGQVTKAGLHLTVDIDAPEEAANWADLCKTPDGNDGEEQEFLPLDESMFESVDNIGYPTDGQRVSISKEEEEIVADSTTMSNDSRKEEVVRLENGVIDDSTKELQASERDEGELMEAPRGYENDSDGSVKPGVTSKDVSSTNHDEDDQVVDLPDHIDSTDHVDSGSNRKLVEGFKDVSISDVPCDYELASDIIKRSEEIVEERLRAASKLSMKQRKNDIENKPLSAEEIDDVSVMQMGNKVMNVEEKVIDTTKSPEMITSITGVAEFGKTKASMEVNTATINEEGQESMSEDRGHLAKQDNIPESQYNLEAAVEETSEKTPADAPTNSEVSNRIDKDPSGQSSDTNFNIERSEVAIGAKRVAGAADAETGRRSRWSGNSVGQKSQLESISKGFPAQRPQKRSSEAVYNEDLKTTGKEDRQKWLDLQLRGLQDAALDHRNTRYFIVEINPRDLVSAYKTNRILTFSMGSIREALSSIHTYPVILFMVVRQGEANEAGLRLCAIALASSPPYAFDVRQRFGDWREVELFDVKFLCKARSRKLLEGSHRHQDEIKRRFADRILGEYAKSIRNGLVDKLLDEISTEQRATGQPYSKSAAKMKQPPSQISDTDQRRFMPQSAAGFQTPPSTQNRGKSQSDSEATDDSEDAVTSNRMQARLKIDVNTDECKEPFSIEPKELWSPTSPTSQRNFNVKPLFDVDSTETSQRSATSQRQLDERVQYEQQVKLRHEQLQQQFQQQYWQQQQPQQFEQQQQQLMYAQKQQGRQPVNQPDQRMPLSQEHFLRHQQLAMQQQQLLIQQEQQQWYQQQQQQQKEQQQFLPQHNQPFPRENGNMSMRMPQQMMQSYSQPRSPLSTPPPLYQVHSPPGQGFQPSMHLPYQVLSPANTLAQERPSVPSTEKNFARLPANMEDFGSDDEPERDLKTEVDVFGLSEEDLAS